MKSEYEVTIKVKVTFDPKDAAGAAKALTWANELLDKKLVEPPEGVNAEITTTPGQIKNRKGE